MSRVKLSALQAGHFTMPENRFVSPCPDESAKHTVPSLSFLVEHVSAAGDTVRIVFDLGLRRQLERYPEPLQKHLLSRQPMNLDEHVVVSLAAAGLRPEDVDFVIYSHVHWDHIGLPSDFPTSTFVVGHGSKDLLAGVVKFHGTHAIFEPDLLPGGRNIELSDPLAASTATTGGAETGAISFERPWRPHPDAVLKPSLERTMDVFGDGTVYIVDAPGHLPGHINLLVRSDVASDSTSSVSVHQAPQYTYLAGDACHDRRLLAGEKEIAHWVDGEGNACCIHADPAMAEQTIALIRALQTEGVEVVFAHDYEWEHDELSKGKNSRLYGG